MLTRSHRTETKSSASKTSSSKSAKQEEPLLPTTRSSTTAAKTKSIEKALPEVVTKAPTKKPVEQVIRTTEGKSTRQPLGNVSNQHVEGEKLTAEIKKELAVSDIKKRTAMRKEEAEIEAKKIEAKKKEQAVEESENEEESEMEEEEEEDKVEKVIEKDFGKPTTDAATRSPILNLDLSYKTKPQRGKLTIPMKDFLVDLAEGHGDIGYSVMRKRLLLEFSEELDDITAPAISSFLQKIGYNKSVAAKVLSQEYFSVATTAAKETSPVKSNKLGLDLSYREKPESPGKLTIAMKDYLVHLVEIRTGTSYVQMVNLLLDKFPELGKITAPTISKFLKDIGYRQKAPVIREILDKEVEPITVDEEEFDQDMAEPVKRGGNIKVTSEIKHYMIELHLDNPQMTYKAISETLVRQFPELKSLSPTTVSRHLKEAGYHKLKKGESY